MRHSSRLALLLPGLPLLCALVIESGKDDVNLRAPAQLPGFANVGARASMSAIYLGNGWVLTARHVGAGDVVLGGVTHPAVPESTLELGASSAPPHADLIVFRIESPPELPPLRIRPTPPKVGDPVILVGAGHDRGASTRWNGHDGFVWDSKGGIRWGTNRVFAAGIDVGIADVRTRSFAVRFDAGETLHEAQAAVGDSGGAVFIAREGRFELAGVMTAVATYDGQPPATSFYGNVTTAADLSRFHEPLTQLLRTP